MYNMHMVYAMLERILNCGLEHIHERQLWLNNIIKNNDIVKEFELLKTDEERFTYSLKTLLDYDTNRWFVSKCEQKVSKHSIKSCNDGNKSYTHGQFKKAVQEYTESVVYAADSSEELALAFGNRSAALFQLKKYKDCIKDIDRALNLEYPDRLKTVLYRRKGLCLTRLRSPGADSSFRDALIWNDKKTVSKDEMERSKVELENLISAPSPVFKPPVRLVQYPEQKILTPNPKVPCASDAIAIKYSEKFGRHLIASRRIEPGELLILEKPYCSRLKYEHIYTHCSHCLQESWSLIACEYCVNVAYCSETCKDNARNEYHEIECPLVGLLLDFQMKSQFWIGVKMVIIATQQGTELVSVKEELEKVDRHMDPCTKGFSEDGKFDSSEYRSAYSLSDTTDKCYTKQILLRSLWVSLTVCMMARETNMFGKKLTVDHTLLTMLDVVFIGQLILKYVHIICSNIHGYGSASRDLNTEFASGLLPFCSLINHSCDPNTVRHWHIDSMAFHAIYPIEQGEQIFDNYGACCCTMTERERQEALKTWEFTCECLPCRKDWPYLWHMPSYKRQSSSRKNKHQLERMMLKLMVTYRTLLTKSNVENLTNMLNELLKAIESLLILAKKPCKELYMLVLAVQEFYRAGNTIYDYLADSPGSEVPPGLLEFHKRLQEVLL